MPANMQFSNTKADLTALRMNGMEKSQKAIEKKSQRGTLPKDEF